MLSNQPIDWYMPLHRTIMNNIKFTAYLTLIVYTIQYTRIYNTYMLGARNKLTLIKSKK